MIRMQGRLFCKQWLGLMAACMILTASGRAADMKSQAIELRCEYKANPIGLDTPQPRLFWQLRAPGRDRAQSAYRILVADSAEAIAKRKGNLWDSGKVKSNSTIQVVYGGKPLASDRTYYWAVRVWDEKNNAGDFSPAASFQIGLLKPDDWAGARWIGRWDEEQWKQRRQAKNELDRNPKYRYGSQPIWEEYEAHKNLLEGAPLLRKEFTLAKPIRQAHAYICGLGYYELYVNGKRAGDQVLDPAFTQYEKRVLYATYDVTDAMVQGANAIGVMLGRGFYNDIVVDHLNYDLAPWIDQSKLLLRLSVDFEDGTHSDIVSDLSWKAADGPILFDDVRVGEVYDARQEKADWDKPGYNEAGWEAVRSVPAPLGKVSAQTMDPIRVVETVQPVKLTQPKPGEYVYSMPFNMAGWAKIRLKGPAGTHVVVKYCETLNKDGSFFDNSGAGRRQQACYVMKGEGEEVYEPRFTYYGFQYISIEGCPTTPTLEMLEGRWVHSDVDRIGSFQCSNPLLNQLQTNIVRTVLNNMYSVPTDCPHREKMGWMGDGHVMAESDVLNLDMAQFYANWVRNMEDSMSPEGMLPSTSPNNGQGWGWGDSPTWVGAFLIVPWQMYQYYGDRRVLETHYAAMKRYVDYIGQTPSLQTGKAYIIQGGWGDWVPPHDGKTEDPQAQMIYGTTYYYHVADLMSRIAGALNQGEDARKYRALAESIRKAMNDAFFNPRTNQYLTFKNGDFLQSANALPLAFGMVPEDHRRQVSDNLARDIMEKKGGHLDAGLLGTKALIDCLPAEGRDDVAYRVVTQVTFPGWLWQIIQHGATTAWEQWNGDSLNHAMFGVPTQFFYKSLAGIQVDSASPAFERFAIRPYLAKDLTHAEATIQTLRGPVESRWQLREGSLRLQIRVPVGSIATVYVPVAGRANASITEGGRQVWADGRFQKGVVGIHGAKSEAQAVVLEVGSGCYQFEVTGKQ